jgi:hypothetical protein
MLFFLARFLDVNHLLLNDIAVNIFKINFARNEVISCQAVDYVFFNGEYYYEHNNGRLIYALVRASDESKAIAMTGKIVQEVADKI